MKKLLSLLLALSMLLGMTGALAADEANLVLAFPYSNKAPEDIAEVEAALNELTKEKIGATVTLIPVAIASWAEQFNLLMTGNEQVDLIYINNVFSSAVSKKYLLPLNDLLAANAPELVEVVGDYTSGGSINGVCYAVPTLRDLATQSGIMLLKEYVDKYEIDVTTIKSYADLTPVWAKIKEGEGENFYPFFMNNTQWHQVTSCIMGDSLGDMLGILAPNDTEGKVVNRFELPEYREIIELLRSWYEAGYINPDAATTKVTFLEAVKSNICAGYVNAMHPGQPEKHSTMNAREMVGVAIGAPLATTSNAQAAMWGITYKAEDPALAAKLMNLMYSDKDFYNTLSWGIEGKHYVFTEDGHIDYPEGVDSQNTGWGLNLGWALGNQFLSYVWAGNPLNQYDLLKEYNAGAVISKANGFTFDTAKVKSAYAACLAVLDEYRLAMETGSLDLSKLEEMNQKLYASGLQSIMDEKQAQLDVFLGK